MSLTHVEIAIKLAEARESLALYVKLTTNRVPELEATRDDIWIWEESCKLLPWTKSKVEKLELQLATTPARSAVEILADLTSHRDKLALLKQKTYRYYSNSSIPEADWSHGGDYGDFWEEVFDRGEIKKLETVVIPALEAEQALAIHA